MIPSNSILWQRILERDRAAQCILRYYGSDAVVRTALGPKIANVVADAIEFTSSPSLQHEFEENARRARRKSFVSPIHMSFIRRWWTMMDERSELWNIVKSVPVPCRR